MAGPRRDGARGRGGGNNNGQVNLARLWSLLRLLAWLAVATVIGYWYTRPRDDPVAARWALRDSELDAAVSNAAHPIERLHWRARREHEHMLRRQSSTYIEARDEYRRRHGGRQEPWAFSAWYHLARRWHTRIIDDYDHVAEQLAPFREHFAHGCDQKVYDREFLERWRLLQVCFRRKTVEFWGFEDAWFTAAIRFMAEEMLPWAPNVCILVNVDEEPRVLLPRDGGNAGDGDSYAKPLDEGGCAAPVFDDRSRRTIWPQVSEHCPVDGPPAPAAGEAFNETYLENIDEYTDLCRIGPSFPHGLLHSPNSMKFTTDRVPILSAARISPFNDVLFPSPRQIIDDTQYFETDDPDWLIKLPYVYWRGSTGGGYARDEQWNFHRQSLVRQLSQKHANNINIRFTDIVQCEERACEVQNQTLPLGERQPLAMGWGYKMVLDVDGSGASGRLHDLLQSKSLVLRHSFIREWHDQYLRPWLHYVPLPADYAQVDGIIDYFLTPEGDRVGKMIADEGRRWANESLRMHESKLYFVRLILEMGRDKRPPVWD